MGNLFLVLLMIIFIMLIVYVAMGVKIIHPYEKGVVEQLGRYKGTVEPGLRLIYPFVQRIRPVDMREQVIDVPPQEVITEDNVAVSVDAVIYFEPTDPMRLLYNISNFRLAVTKLAQTNLRNVIGEMSLDEAFTSRERVNGALRQILDDATDKWGVRVVRVEIQRIDPPQDVMHAMHEQMKAERTRRAVVTEAEGAREAAVTRAQGEKTSAILTAEGRKQHEILMAEGEAQAVRTKAEAEQYRQEVVALGEATAIRSVYSAINQSGTDERVIAIKYLEALQGIADGQATKIFLPADLSATLGSIGGIAELFRNDAPNGNGGSGKHGRRPLPDADFEELSDPEAMSSVAAMGRGEQAQARTTLPTNPPLPPQRDILPPPASAAPMPPPPMPPGT
jgi:regulator of protease activity HflC (stomatin/prohibitin superfamily)